MKSRHASLWSSTRSSILSPFLRSCFSGFSSAPTFSAESNYKVGSRGQSRPNLKLSGPLLFADLSTPDTFASSVIRSGPRKCVPRLTSVSVDQQSKVALSQRIPLLIVQSAYAPSSKMARMRFAHPGHLRLFTDQAKILREHAKLAMAPRARVSSRAVDAPSGTVCRKPRISPPGNRVV